MIILWLDNGKLVARVDDRQGIAERSGAVERGKINPFPFQTLPMASIRANARKVICIGRNYAYVFHFQSGLLPI